MILLRIIFNLASFTIFFSKIRIPKSVLAISILFEKFQKFLHFFFSNKKITYSFSLDANKRNSDLDVNNGFSWA
jgi:hypothetical protein